MTLSWGGTLTSMKLDYRIGEYDTSSAILDELSYNMEIYFVKVKMARLREGHPLALQVNLRSGVANGGINSKE